MLEGKKIKITTSSGFEPVPMDRYQVWIRDVNLVKQFSPWKGEEVEVLNYQFEILDDKPMPAKEGEKAESTQGRFLWKRCSPSLNPKSWLNKLVNGVIGRDLTKEEAENFDPESLVGKQVMVMVEQTPGKDGTTIFNNIVAFSKPAKDLEVKDIELAKPPKMVERATVPATAPQEEENPDKFIQDLEAESAKAK